MSEPRDCVPALRAVHMTAMAEWASTRPVRHGWKGRTCRDIWAAAPRGDWLLAYAVKAGSDRRDLVRAAAACARPALRFVPAGENRPRLAIKAAERWADGPTEENRRRTERAADAARRAAWTAQVAAAWTAAAAGATVAATVAATASWRAADAAGLAARRGAEAHGHAEGPESEAAAHRACADAVRRLVPFLELTAGRPR